MENQCVGLCPFFLGYPKAWIEFALRRRTLVPTSQSMDVVAWIIEGNAATRLLVERGNVTRTAMPGGRALVQQELRTRLMRRGLSGPIADSLLFTWRPELFGSPDRRVIWLLSQAAYDAMLPIEIVPAPEYRVRVGVVIEKF